MRISTLVFPLVLLLAGTLVGCSGGSGSSVLPDEVNNLTSLASNPLFVSDWDSSGNPKEGMGTLGYFSISLDPSKATAELTPARNSALTDVLEIIDITNFMQIFPCVDCVKINSVGIDVNEHLVVNMGIKHPFDKGNPAEAITGKNRADLHVLNVEGIVVSNTTGETFSTLSQSTPGFRLVNAHGYTDYLDAAIDEIYNTSATIHPYVTHFRDYTQGNYAATNPMGFASVVDPPPSGYMVMAMGATYSNADYVFDVDGPMNFIFAIGCTYAVTTETFEDRFEPEYRCPQHNKKAASEVSVSITSNELAGGDTSSTAQIEIRVVDINHGIPVGTELNQMFADSSVSEIAIEIPGVMTNILTIAGGSAVSGTGLNPSDPLVYQATITNTAGGAEGTYTGLVKVKDAYAPGQNTHPFIGTNDGGARVDTGISPLQGLFEISEFATYQVFPIDVAALSPPVGQMTHVPDPPRINQNETISLDATSSYDPDGTIMLYEFDFIWDGTSAGFAADVSNTTGLATSTPYPDYGNYYVGLRVTDNDSLVGWASFTVEVNRPPIAILDKVPDVPSLPQYSVLTLDATFSNDPAGTLQSYEFDFDWDGVPANFNVDVSEPTGIVEHRLFTPGNFTIGLKVTDVDNASDYDSVDIEVTSLENVIFVDDDNTAGPWDGSFNNPYQYVQDGVDAALDNYTVWVLPGLYMEDFGGDPSSGEAEISITGISGFTIHGEAYPVISLHEYTGSDRAGLKASGCTGITIDGLAFMPASSYKCAIEMDECDNGIVNNCLIMPDTSGFGGFLNALNSSNLTCQNNILDDPEYDMGLLPGFITAYNCPDLLITLNHISSLGIGDIISSVGSISWIYCTESPGLEISKNIINSSYVFGGPDDQITVIYVGAGSDNAEIRNNLFYSIGLIFNSESIKSSTCIDVEAVTNALIYNNTMNGIFANSQNDNATCTTYGIYVDQLTTPDIYNNIVTDISAKTNAYGMYKSSGAELVVDYCDVWTVEGGTTSERYHEITEGPNGLDEDPIYGSVMFGNYHLVDRSPCWDGGRDGEQMGAYGGSDPLPD